MHKVKSLATLRSRPKLRGEKSCIEFVRLFDRHILISEREIKTNYTLLFAFTPTPMSVFDEIRVKEKQAIGTLARISSKFDGGSCIMSSGRLI